MLRIAKIYIVLFSKLLLNSSYEIYFKNMRMSHLILPKKKTETVCGLIFQDIEISSTNKTQFCHLKLII